MREPSPLMPQSVHHLSEHVFTIFPVYTHPEPNAMANTKRLIRKTVALHGGRGGRALHRPRG